jgi:cytoskeletal protein CcmA (bactofilin family)
VFLLAIVALTTLLILGTSLLEMTINGLASATRDSRRSEAFALAESGVEMALAKLYDNYDGANDVLEATGAYSGSFTFPEGSVSYVIQAPYQGIADTCVVTSQATSWRNEQVGVRVVASYVRDPSRTFEGAIFSDSPLTLNGAGTVLPDASGKGGQIYANGNVTFKGTSFTMAPEGAILTTGETNWVPPQVPATSVYQHIAPFTMPVIDLNYYKSIATKIITGNNVTLKSSDLTGIGGVIYVDGNVKISGNFSGQAMIVATGSIQVTGSVEATHPGTDALALLSPKSIKVAGGATVDGLIYAHGVTVDAEATMSGNITVHGAICADVVVTDGSITVTYNDVWAGLPLPGTGKSQWAQKSWEEYYL